MVAPTLRLARRRPAAVVAVVAALAAVVALARRQPLSWDEAVTVAVATRPVHAIAGTLHHSDAVLGAYYLLMHAWGAAAEAIGLRPTEWWWRAPSALAAVGTCVMVTVLARRHAGPAAGLLAGCFLAVMPLFAFYAVDARPYTLAALAVTLAWAVWTCPTARWHPLLYATVTVALLVTAGWLQLFTVLVWPAFLVVGGRRPVRRAVAVLVVAAAGVVPLLSVALGQSDEIGWVPPADISNTLGVAARVGGGLAVVALLTGLVVAAARAGLVHRGPATLAVLWWTCAPITLLAALDVVRPVLVARYVMVSVPLVAVAFGVLVARAGRGRSGVLVRVVGAGTVTAAIVTSALQGAHPWKYEDYRGAATFAVRTVPSGTPVLFAPSSARLGFDRYAPPAALRDLALPNGVAADPLAIDEEAPPLLREQVNAACRVVLVGDPTTGGPTHVLDVDRAKLTAVSGWHVDTARGFGAITVTVLVNPVCSPPASTSS